MTEPDPKTRLISGSEVSTWQRCQMQWFFNFRLNLMPRKMSDGLFTGVVGHEALSLYYSSLAIGNSTAVAQDAMIDFIANEMDKNNKQRKEGYISSTMASERIVLISKLNSILEAYIKFYASSDYINYDIVEVEHMHIDGKGFAMRLDLLLRDTSTGELILVDHKFLRDFYLDKQLAVNSQLPKYMKVIIGNREEDIAYGLLNVLRTRELKDDETGGIRYEFRRDRIDYHPLVAQKRSRDQERVSLDIRKQYQLSVKDSKNDVVRAMSDYTCKFCPYWEPCSADLKGEPMSPLLNMHFERNTYGYNRPADNVDTGAAASAP